MIKTSNINEQRLWQTLMELAEIGASPNRDQGITRLSLSEEELEAKQYVIQLMKEVGLEVRMDAVGNVIGKLNGTDPLAPSVIVGSHTDTVNHGGGFDGALGVLGAIEAVRSMKEANVTLTHSIEVISFTDEEGSRFGTGYIGSKAMAGVLKEDAFELTDQNGISYREAFIKAKLDPTKYKEAVRKPEEMKAYIEMHIEQGKVLEEMDLSVGIVTDIQGPVWLEVQLEGSADHAGATPMNMRKDASLVMAEVMLDVEKTAISHQGVGTVGSLKVEPGGVNIIPGKAVFTVDLRHVDSHERQLMVKDVYLSVAKASEKRGITWTIEVKKEVDPASCSPEIVKILEESFQELQFPVAKLPCGAGHDSLIMSKLTNMGMIFVRSKDGISHNPKEWTSKGDCAAGTEVLFQSLIKLAK
ncbi:Zn-dependent hydrolase [Salipaludibacillus keqinensis]|uniref:Zn-dependent hydrolase n=1 Tax=Salipaludibacillus keqinensis TaxID=2045207 RepID=A0A323TM77_9BACI|nr:Zn-dependent hydrolase [Salipaludibacillus keqinensis]